MFTCVDSGGEGFFFCLFCFVLLLMLTGDYRYIVNITNTNDNVIESVNSWENYYDFHCNPTEDTFSDKWQIFGWIINNFRFLKDNYIFSLQTYNLQCFKHNLKLFH